MAKNVRLLKPEPDLLLLHIELKWIEPAIWRRVAVPENITLSKLHTVIQFAMGWEGGHLHEFEIAGENYGTPDPDGGGPPVNSDARKTLIKALNGKRTFRYLYDFGDGWDHRIKVEKKLPAVACPQVPYCIDGANACPPEDIGGGPGYADFLEAMADPNHPEHDDMLEWHGSTFDPTVFEWERVNQWLKEIKV
ncbi:pRiA4b ORF-3-like protein [Pseudomonas antarctica]|uniref:PRiA4b ORF-3-like protein n=1 Tax=Pseudomonas antarctica TaxID=219572 RepID=A0A1H0BP72_9PSED|nr:plasmid pRiA4b ORF-3 family protein [Pseudomonas antarctica]KAF2406567.1 plasmid pRiA4b ORF-3-like protein [Pseudomonas antarctica]SDN47372.1 pRiA4b ORF-3-like protein [Pseudomonas antarctica]